MSEYLEGTAASPEVAGPNTPTAAEDPAHNVVGPCAVSGCGGTVLRSATTIPNGKGGQRVDSRQGCTDCGGVVARVLAPAKGRATPDDTVEKLPQFPHDSSAIRMPQFPGGPTSRARMDGLHQEPLGVGRVDAIDGAFLTLQEPPKP